MKKSIIILIIVTIIIPIFSIGYFVWYKNAYCSQFSYENCPLDRCKVGGSCPICADIGCHAKDYDKDWTKEYDLGTEF
jgi:hypothetical protein